MSGVCAAIVDNIPVCQDMLSDIVDLVSGDGYRRGCSVALEGGQMNGASTAQQALLRHRQDMSRTHLDRWLLSRVHTRNAGKAPSDPAIHKAGREVKMVCREYQEAMRGV